MAKQRRADPDMRRPRAVRRLEILRHSHGTNGQPVRVGELHEVMEKG